MAVPGIHGPVTYRPQVSRPEVALLAGWERADRRWVTIGDVREGTGPVAAARVASSLVRKGALVRLRPGLYLTRPFRLLARPSAIPAPIALEALLHAEPHYFGGLWALTRNGLTEQQYVSRLDAFVARARRPAKVPRALVRFHVLPVDWLQAGVIEVIIDRVRLRMSGPERTLVDLLDRPAMAGGLTGAVGLFRHALPQVSAGRLAEYAALVARTSTCQRIGLLLDRAGEPPAVLRRLSARTRGTRSLISLEPGPRTGRVNTRWNVVENDHGLVPPRSP